MDPILYNAAMGGNIGAGDFLLDDYLKRDEENGYQVTPKGNTVLHVAAMYGQSSFVQQVIDITPALLRRKNNKNETALHIAANKGHKDVVKVLLLGVVVVVVAGGEGFNKETFMRMTDDNGDTALHKAVRSRHVDVVKILVNEDPEFEFPTNNAEETPLYLAAESGSLNCLMEILESCNRPTYAGPCGRTALHAAVIQKHRAGFTLPGGFESDLNSPNKGMAILIRRTAFRAFVVSDAIAFTCSAGAVFSYFFIAVNAAATKKIKIIRPLFAIASMLQLFAMSAVVIAFGTGMYATLAHSVGLAATVCVISCASFLVYTLLLCAFN